jgi:hypothetical protein
MVNYLINRLLYSLQIWFFRANFKPIFRIKFSRNFPSSTPSSQTPFLVESITCYKSLVMVAGWRYFGGNGKNLKSFSYLCDLICVRICTYA